MASYHDKFPRKDGPPPIIKEGGSKAIFNDTKSLPITVALDIGAFRRLWELAEAEAARTYPTHAMPSTGALLRGVQSLRDAYWAVNEKPVVKKPTGRVVKTNFQRKKAGEAKAAAKKVTRIRKNAPTEIEARPEVPARSVRRIRPR